ncbi:MAG: hypothetical protein KF847_17070, partial [Pirellulales bacterium]|nr:hypothetical protein [Pirellulales bacterium]
VNFGNILSEILFALRPHVVLDDTDSLGLRRFLLYRFLPLKQVAQPQQNARQDLFAVKDAGGEVP